MPPASGGTLLCELAARMLEGATVIVAPDADGSEVEALKEGRTKMARIGPNETAALEGVHMGLLVIEDAHRVSDWSQDYRPEYARLRDLIVRGAPGTVLAIAPVATPRVRADIAEKLALGSPVVHAASHDRRNLVWSVIETQDKAQSLKLALAEQPGPALVIVQRASDADSVAQQLKSMGIAAEAHHAGLEEEAREAALEAWQSDKARVLVSVGLPGSRKRNVRAVIHWQMPSSLEAYFIEALAAGRDGEAAQCVLLYAPDDKASHATGIQRAHPERAAVLEVLDAVWEGRDHGEGPTVDAALRVLEEQGFIRRAGADFAPSPDAPERKRLDTLEVERRGRQAEERLRMMSRYAESRGCRRMEMLAYFGERLPAGWQCAGCDRCRTAREGASPDAGVARQAVIMGVRDLEGRRFSITEMARAILFLAPPHVTRALKGKSETEVRDLINALLREGAIELDPRAQFVRSRR
jgi:ATP-dependent DNA helicase RecQ